MRPSDELFLSLLRQEQGKLLRIARALTGQEADAWDMVQETTVAAYEQFHNLRGGPASFGPWMRRILVNRCRNFLKARSRGIPLELAEPGYADPGPGPEAQVTGEQIWTEVIALADHYRQVLVLRFLVDMSVEEIGALLEVPPGTVKSRLHRALKILRQRLEESQKGTVMHG